MSFTETGRPPKDGFERDLVEVAALNLPKATPTLLNSLNKAALSQRPEETLLDLDLDELTALIKELGQPTFRAKQVWGWLYQNFADAYAEMNNLPKPLLEKLSAQVPLAPLEVVTEKVAYDGQTRKALFRLSGGAEIETVLMLYADRATVCVSTQAGCAMACSFCATGQLGLTRNLQPGEIVQQVLHFERFLSRTTDPRLTLSLIHI